MNALGIALVWCAVQVTLFGLLAGAVYLACRRWQPASGTLVTVAGLAGILALSAMALSPWPRWSLVDPSEQTPPPAARSARQHDPHVTPSNEAALPAEAGPVEEATGEGPSFAALFWEAAADVLAGETAQPEARPWRWPAAAGAFFLIAAGLGAVWLVAGLLSVGAYRAGSRPITEAALSELVEVLRAELGCRRPIELRCSHTLVTAATIGWRRPVVILPAEWTGWTDDQCRAVLAHEIAHVRDGHFLGMLCGQLGVMLHFYHPLVHWLVHRLRLEQELAADAAAAGVMGGQRRYLTAIAELALRQSDRPLVWPARSFLPTRNTFLRRIAMLRDAKLYPGRLAPAARSVVLGAVFACAVLVAGLRGPADRRQAIALQAAPAMEASADVIDLSWVPSDAVAIAAFRPAAIFRYPELKRLREVLDNTFQLSLHSLAEIEQLALVLLHKPDPAKPVPAALGQPVVMLRFTQPGKAEEVIRTVFRDSTAKDYRGTTYRVASRGGVAMFQPDDQTIIGGSESDVLDVVRGRGGPLPEILGGKRTWRAFQNDHAVVAADASVTMASFAQMAGTPGFAAPFAPLWEDTTTAMLGARLDDRVKVRAVAASDNEEGAVRVEETLNALQVLARNYTVELRRKVDESPESEPGMIASARAAQDLVAGASIRREGNVVRLQASGDLALLELSEAFLSAGQTAQRVQSTNHLKQIAIAMHNFHDTWKCFPPAVLHKALPPRPSTPPGDSQPYSWRVALLPYLEQIELYKQYRFDEPWDSPANLEVLKKMPAVYRNPGDPPDSTRTSFLAFVGPGTVFCEEEGTSPLGGTPIRQIRDGTSATLLVVEAKRSVPWTKPEDIPYDPQKPLPELGGHFEGGFLAALCDGSVHFLPVDLEATLLRMLIEKSDGQVVDWGKIDSR